MPEIAAEAVPVFALDVRVRNRGGQLTVGRGAESYELSDTAAAVWRLIDGERDVAAIAAAIAAEYEVEPDVVRADVAELLAELASWGAVEFAKGI